jgi:hypothetical protein
MIILFITYILNVIDYLFTSYWIHLYGLEVEANPIARWMFEHDIAGFIKIVIAGLIYIVIGYIVHKYPKYKWTTYILFLLYAFIFVYHIIIALFVF